MNGMPSECYRLVPAENANGYVTLALEPGSTVLQEAPGAVST